MPVYQKDAVEQYLSNTTAMAFAGGKGKNFNVHGRGYPDISALSHKFFIVMSGEPGILQTVDGTSAAAPTIAGLVGLINSERLQAGKPAVGFMNPLLYAVHASTPFAFNDITEGDNRCSESGCQCTTGFPAAKGWDASTGLGTPNFGVMLEAIRAMDKERERRQ